MRLAGGHCRCLDGRGDRRRSARTDARKLERKVDPQASDEVWWVRSRTAPREVLDSPESPTAETVVRNAADERPGPVLEAGDHLRVRDSGSLLVGAVRYCRKAHWILKLKRYLRFSRRYP